MDEGNGVKNGKDTGTKQVNKVANHEPLSGFSCVLLLPGRACGGVVCTCACATRPAFRTCGFSALPRTLFAVKAGGARDPRTRGHEVSAASAVWTALAESTCTVGDLQTPCSLLQTFTILPFRL
ncbi:hypothetical protein K0M31_003489 [Melipona bicolor]|uniref:Uncharacterized protein n=1 Tax=Melipona bicolor TaxID=60889 RepID=A0AA40FZY6_9HYME|nr:hypothetical protein K0M31_003489 [Melipona bicolor]